MSVILHNLTKLVDLMIKAGRTMERVEFTDCNCTLIALICILEPVSSKKIDLLVMAIGNLYNGRQDSTTFRVVLSPPYRSCKIPGDAYDKLKQFCATRVFSQPDGTPSSKEFKPYNFFEFFERNIGVELSPEPFTGSRADAFPRGKLCVEESDKTLFCGIMMHTEDGKHVTEANLHKTGFLLGANAMDYCRAHNISTCWTDDVRRSINCRTHRFFREMFQC